MFIRYFFWSLGAIALVLGIIGIFLPVMPTVPFILLAASCWAKASPRFYRWLRHHRYFGPMIQNWESNRAIPRRAKILACAMMTISCIGLLLTMPERWWIAATAALGCTVGALIMWRFPDA